MSLCANTKTYDFVDCHVKSMKHIYIYIYICCSRLSSHCLTLLSGVPPLNCFVCNGCLIHLESQQESPWSQPNDDASTHDAGNDESNEWHDARNDGRDDDASGDDATPWCRGIR